MKNTKTVGRYDREVRTAMRLMRYAWPHMQLTITRAGGAAGDMWRFKVEHGWFEALVGDGQLTVREAGKELQQLPVRKRARNGSDCLFGMPLDTFRFLQRVSLGV